MIYFSRIIFLKWLDDWKMCKFKEFAKFEIENVNRFMKKYAVTTAIFITSLTATAQNELSGNSYKDNKSVIKMPDTFKLKTIGTINSKIDTLYFKNLNSDNKESENNKAQFLQLLGVLLGGVIAIVGQYYIRKQDKNINSHNLKEAKRIQNLENVFQIISRLSIYDRNSLNELLKDIQNLEKYVYENALYIDKPYERVVQNICDYYKEVVTDFNKKNYATEIENVNRFKNLFSK